jgi:arginine decarboxylase
VRWAGSPEERREEVAVPAGSNAYNSLWQVRTDAWSALEESTAQLALAGAQQRPVEQLTDAVAEALAVLAPIERFWAFPGMQAFYKVRQLFATGKYHRCATLVARINRTLATDSYRGGHADADADADDEAYEHEVGPAAQSRQDRPYFEVLVVEDMTEDQERALREELRRWRRPDDQFLYEIVVVPSFDDAVMAARLNFRLQACVVRRRFTHRSRHDCSSLAQFVSLGECEDLMDCSPDERAQVLARSLARIRPELDLYLMTEIAATTRPAPPPDPPGPALARAGADVALSTSPDAP